MTCQSKTTTLSRRDFNRSLATLAAGAMAGGTATAAGKPLGKVRFGKTDLLVTRYSQGTAFREIPRNDNPQTRRVLHRCLDVGINFFDSAEAYSWGESEKLLGRVIKGRRDKVVICTKAAPSLAPAKDPKTNKFKLGQPVAFTRKVLAQKCEGSLRRLGTDHLDLFLLHDDDGKTPPAEIAESMDRLVKAGKVRYWGLSNFSAANVRRFASLPRQNSRSRVSGTEDYFHIAAGLRMPTDLLQVVGNAGLGILAFSPQDCGRLSPGRKENAAYGSLIDTLDEVAAELDTTRARVLIAWSLANPAVTSVLGGAESVAHVDDNIGGTHLQIPTELMARLSEASRAHTRRRRARAAGRSGK
jgi:aryl-alcohol dehydrogenase-like predicted oxidoreductase